MWIAGWKHGNYNAREEIASYGISDAERGLDALEKETDDVFDFGYLAGFYAAICEARCK